LINIDGSYGEGGGQILRSAIAMSVLTKKPVNISNIRSNRPIPGLKPQHYTAINIIKDISNAKTEGLEIGSSNLIFTPGEIKGGNYKFDIGTAGSIVLVFQACLLAFVNIKEEINIKLSGGTDVKWCPSWDYFEHVFIPMVKKIGVSVNVELIKRGYYPKGGGIAKISIKPFQKLIPLNFGSNQLFDTIHGIIHLGNLPEHIGKRMKHSTIKILTQNNLKSSINIDSVESLSNGTGITLWAENNNTILGYTILGEKGIPAEKIGEKCATGIINEVQSGANIDIHNFDQILPYLVLLDNEVSTFNVKDVSSHAETNMWLISQFFEDKDIFNVSDINNFKKIKIKGKMF
jgi:RNA 3'-terminal phosphate cyclase (ATP)